MNIREFVPGDTEKVLEIWFEASRSAHWFLGDSLLRSLKEEVRNKYIPMAETWISEEHGELIGFISLIGNYIGALFVHPFHQGKGAGTCLIKKASSIKNELAVGVYEKNQRAQKFYKGLHFIETDSEIQSETSERVINMKLVS